MKGRKYWEDGISRSFSCFFFFFFFLKSLNDRFTSDVRGLLGGFSNLVGFRSQTEFLQSFSDGDGSGGGRVTSGDGLGTTSAVEDTRSRVEAREGEFNVVSGGSISGGDNTNLFGEHDEVVGGGGGVDDFDGNTS